MDILRTSVRITMKRENYSNFPGKISGLEEKAFYFLNKSA